MKTSSIFILFFTIIFHFSIDGAHIVGGEMTYECLGEDPNSPDNNLYQFTLKIYRDCFSDGSNFDSAPGSFLAASITIYEGEELFTFFDLETVVIDSLELSIPYDCLINGSESCIEVGTYTFMRSLRRVENTYTIIYQRCCRSSLITNLQVPDKIGSSFFVALTAEAQMLCNNSLTFDPLTQFVVCNGEPMNLPMTAFDIDGDELIYEFCAPLDGGSTSNVAPNPEPPPPYSSVQFIEPDFSSLNPMGLNSPISIDLNTGLINGTPMVLGRYELGICVNEYRNGILINSIMRDVQIIVDNCVDAISAEITKTPDDPGTTTGEGILTANPMGGTPPYTYQWNDPNMQTTNEANGLLNGEYMVTITDASGCQIVVTDTVSFFTTTKGWENITRLKIFPNPAQNLATLEIKLKVPTGLNVICYNAIGEKVYNFENLKGQHFILPIDFREHNSGIYYWCIKSKTGQVLKTVRQLVLH